MELSDTGLGGEQPVEAYLDERPDDQDRADEDRADQDPVAKDRAGNDGPGDAPDQPAAEAKPRPKPAKKRGRASVPSWDEIMFGGGKGD